MISTKAVTTPRSFLDVVTGQRACRQFSDRPVSDEDIGFILNAAVHAPSAMNHQPWIFVVVRDNNRRAEIVGVMRELWCNGGRAATEGMVPEELLHEVDRGFMSTLEKAPVLVLVAGDTDVAPAEQLPWSVYPAVQNMLLGATALGLGSALTTMGVFRAADLRSIVGLPDHLLPMAVVPVGWPARAMRPPRRTPFEMKAFRDQYGMPW